MNIGRQKQGKIKAIHRLLRTYYGDHEWWPGDSPFEIMLGAILTQNTAWTNVERAIENIQKRGVLTAQKLHALSDCEIARLIKPTGFFNVKTKRVRSFLEYFRLSYGFSVERMKAVPTDQLRLELLAVKGIGKETADSILLYALDKPVFVVDTYTKRIFSRHGICKHDVSYDTLQDIFQGALKRDVMLYNDFHAQIVNCAKDFCRTKPRCGDCPLNKIKPICFSATDKRRSTWIGS